MIKIGLCEGTINTGNEILFSYLRMGGGGDATATLVSN